VITADGLRDEYRNETTKPVERFDDYGGTYPVWDYVSWLEGKVIANRKVSGFCVKRNHDDEINDMIEME